MQRQHSPKSPPASSPALSYGMPTIELFTWRVPSPLKPGATYLTRYKMTRQEAQARHPGAEAVESSREVREVDCGPSGHGAAAAIVAAGGSGHDRWK